MYEVRPSFVLLPFIESVWLRIGPFMCEAVAHLDSSYQVDRHVEAIRRKDAAALKDAITANIQDGRRTCRAKAPAGCRRDEARQGKA